MKQLHSFDKESIEECIEYILTCYKLASENQLYDRSKKLQFQGRIGGIPHYLMILPILNASIIKRDVVEVADSLRKIIKYNDMYDTSIQLVIKECLEYYIIDLLRSSYEENNTQLKKDVS